MLYKQLPNIKIYNKNGEKIDPFGEGEGNSSSPQNDYVTRDELSDAAFTGDYNDLRNKPEIPSNYNEVELNIGGYQVRVDGLTNLKPYPTINIIKPYIIPNPRLNYQTPQRKISSYNSNLGASSGYSNITEIFPDRSNRTFIIKRLPYFYRILFDKILDYRFGQSLYSVHETEDSDFTTENISDYCALCDVEIHFDNDGYGEVFIRKYTEIKLRGAFISGLEGPYATNNYFGSSIPSYKFTRFNLNDFIKVFNLVPDPLSYIGHNNLSDPSYATATLGHNDDETDYNCSSFEPLNSFLDNRNKDKFTLVFRKHVIIYKPKGALFNNLVLTTYDNPKQIEFEISDANQDGSSLEDSLDNIDLSNNTSMAIHLFLTRDTNAENFLHNVTIGEGSAIHLYIHNGYNLLNSNINEAIQVHNV